MSNPWDSPISDQDQKALQSRLDRIANETQKIREEISDVGDSVFVIWITGIIMFLCRHC